LEGVFASQPLGVGGRLLARGVRFERLSGVGSGNDQKKMRIKKRAQAGSFVENQPAIKKKETSATLGAARKKGKEAPLSKKRVFLTHFRFHGTAAVRFTPW